MIGDRPRAAIKILNREEGAARSRPRSADFRRGREEGWRLLESLVRKAEEDGLGSLTADEARRLPLLYRLTVSSLSVARSMVLDRNLLLYLENLSLRAYLLVYGPRASLAARALDFVKRGFPRQVRAMRFHLLLAAFVLSAGVCAGYATVAGDPELFHLLVPETLADGRGPGSSAEELHAAMFAPFAGVFDTFVVFASFLFRHNTMLGILSFGLGAVFGLPTALLLAYNGVVIGAMIAIHAGKGKLGDFIGWLGVHGVTETLAILLCAAAGFVLAEKIVFPGPRSRLDSLAVHGRAAAGAVTGAVGLFFIAGLLEGGIRQLVNDTPARCLVALLTAAAWLYYFARVGTEGGGGDGH